MNMGSFIELNDTLQITRDQGFPKELDLTRHMSKPFQAADFAGQVFEFRDKKDPRVYHMPPVRVFFAESIDGKWLYWGHAEILEINIDTVKRMTSGKYRITKIFTFEEMKSAFNFLDNRSEIDYLK